MYNLIMQQKDSVKLITEGTVLANSMFPEHQLQEVYSMMQKETDDNLCMADVKFMLKKLEWASIG